MFRILIHPFQFLISGDERCGLSSSVCGIVCGLSVQKRSVSINHSILVRDSSIDAWLKQQQTIRSFFFAFCSTHGRLYVVDDMQLQCTIPVETHSTKCQTWQCGTGKDLDRFQLLVA